MHRLLNEINAAAPTAPRLWWLGGFGSVIKFHQIVFYLDPVLPDGIEPFEIDHADMVLRTHVDADDPDPTPEILEASPRAKVIVPKSNADQARMAGISYERMTTTDAGLRVEFWKAGVYGRVYSVPSSHHGLGWTPVGGYPYLGYLVRFGEQTIYHSGACVPYEGLADRLRPYNVTVALLPVGEGNFQIAQAAELAEDIQASWVVPINCDEETVNRFTDHMLGHRPSQKFKIFHQNEGWTIPEDVKE